MFMFFDFLDFGFLDFWVWGFLHFLNFCVLHLSFQSLETAPREKSVLYRYL